MAEFQAVLVDAVSGAGNTYPFEGPADLFMTTPVRITRTFMEYVDVSLFPKQHADYEINATFKDAEHQVVTTIGILMFENNQRSPFMLMISPKKG